ncbi:WXG100 family type VII secretion target [Streptomyces sp. FXJ1.172]|uniref:WXG100 family type VII secretion target n=1 Tax=Streptomyces sp. FXJ1.172 TaxID=710705 RepID=UPI0007CF3BB2|nr:WXG100 family type VII secretion target [Streptomyces sp. FXJ1.172]WEO94933.1 WXG100 family type VII secretion target [Streptomyces sp. FXJ1.172]
MAAGTQKITKESVAGLEGELLERFNHIQDQLKMLQHMLDTLEGHWKGIGAGAFNAKQTEINERMVRMGNILVKFIDAMNTTMKINNSTEDQVRASVQKIDVDYGGSHSALSSL